MSTDIVHEIIVNALAETVFDALATERGLKGWWTTNTQSSGSKQGATASFGFYNKKMTLKMLYDKAERGLRLAWACVDGPDVWRGTTVAFDLAAADAGPR
ncbi:MAG: hypothetical protein EXQ93_03645 [Alphaproteobacteria bacterium]|nr:hypothetical protein [Alphaproteobacteria bacterium]